MLEGIAELDRLGVQSSRISSSLGSETNAFSTLLADLVTDKDPGAKDSATMLLFGMMMGDGLGSEGSYSLMISALARALAQKAPTNGQELLEKELPPAEPEVEARLSPAQLNSYISQTSLDQDAIPARPHKAVNPAITNSPGQRSPASYQAVINQFQVESNPRYAVNQKGKNDTYCNIFMWDVTRAMGAEIPHYMEPGTMEPRYYPDTKGAWELNANAICDWLKKMGSQYGWNQVSASQAQDLANQGRPVVAVMRNDGGIGHVQVVCPSRDGGFDPERGVTVAQAGRKLYNYAHITKTYSSKNLAKVLYYAHD